MRSLTLILALLAGLVAGTPASAQTDHDRARRAMQAGTIVPLERIVNGAHRVCRGRVLDVQLAERGRGMWIYHLKFLTPQGNVLNLRFDARNGRLMDINGRGQRAACG